MSNTVARRAVVIHREHPQANEERLGRILTFFGVPWEALSLEDVADSAQSNSRHDCYAVLGSVETLGAAVAIPHAAAVLKDASAIYAYASENRDVSIRALSMLAGSRWMWRSPSNGRVPIEITALCPEFTGPMSGLHFDTQLTQDQAVAPSEESPDSGHDANAGANRFVPIISVEQAHGFVRINYKGVPTYFCASTAVVDIDASVGHNYYDVKVHFLSAVPLVMFITWAFRDVMWRPNELGACLIIDDPLLQERYGFCDFRRLRELMVSYDFTTNIAFIPWNWRRTSVKGSSFFQREREYFSVSVHGCDHTAAEFGVTAIDTLDSKVKLARARMRQHVARTSIHHEPIMIFPQGVFSSRCPEVLKRNGFVAAINTEGVPADGDGDATRIRDLWDIAIMSYGSFPIYTRRYAFHGIENFAFDLLLGKPCFIVAHHQFFKDKETKLIDLLSRLSALGTSLQWRSPREVVRRAYRRRNLKGTDEIEMYATELVIPATSSHSHTIRLRKRETETNAVAEVECDGVAHTWQLRNGFLEFSAMQPEHGERLLTVHYADYQEPRHRVRSIQYEVAVAARRLLSEFRDELAWKVRFVNAS